MCHQQPALRRRAGTTLIIDLTNGA